jgi:predicted DNA-binding transcriptional regulator AlpA
VPTFSQQTLTQPDPSYTGLLRLHEVLELTKLHKTRMYELIQAGLAPAPIKYPGVDGEIKPNSISYWVKAEWMQWLEDRVAARDARLRELAEAGLHGIWSPGRSLPEEARNSFGGRA